MRRRIGRKWCSTGVRRYQKTIWKVIFQWGHLSLVFMDWSFAKVVRRRAKKVEINGTSFQFSLRKGRFCQGLPAGSSRCNMTLKLKYGLLLLLASFQLPPRFKPSVQVFSQQTFSNFYATIKVCRTV